MHHQLTIPSQIFQLILTGSKKFWLAPRDIAWNKGDTITFIEAHDNRPGLTGEVFHSRASYLEDWPADSDAPAYFKIELDPHNAGKESSSPPPCSCDKSFKNLS